MTADDDTNEPITVNLESQGIPVTIRANQDSTVVMLAQTRSLQLYDRCGMPMNAWSVQCESVNYAEFYCGEDDVKKDWIIAVGNGGTIMVGM